MKTFRQVLSWPFVFIQMAVAFCVLWPMKTLANLLMRGMLGSQRHIYYPIVVSRRVVAGEPAWQPVDAVYAGIRPRTPAQQKQLEEYLAERGAIMPVPASVELPVGHPESPVVGTVIKCGRHDDLTVLHRVAGQYGRHAVDYQFVAADYDDETCAWAIVTDERVIANVDKMHEMVNAMGGVRGAPQSRKTDDTPMLVARLVGYENQIGEAITR